MNIDTVTGLVDKLIIPVGLAVMGWIVKDWLLDSYKARQLRVREEWLYQLREVYCPLFLWSGVVTFDGKKGPDKFGVTELTRALNTAASLIPINHYHVFIRLLEAALGQKTTPVSEERLKLARDFLYSKIEHLQIALFGRYADYDPTRALNTFEPLRGFSSSLMDFLIQLSIWAVVLVTIAALYWAIAGNGFATTGLVLVLVLVVVAELRRRIRTFAVLKRRLRQ